MIKKVTIVALRPKGMRVGEGYYTWRALTNFVREQHKGIRVRPGGEYNTRRTILEAVSESWLSVLQLKFSNYEFRVVNDPNL